MEVKLRIFDQQAMQLFHSTSFTIFFSSNIIFSNVFTILSNPNFRSPRHLIFKLYFQWLIYPLQSIISQSG